MAMYHAVNYNFSYYAVNSPNSSATESAPVLAWIPQAMHGDTAGCVFATERGNQSDVAGRQRLVAEQHGV